MSHEKQNGVPKRRPIPHSGTQSPKIIGGGNAPSKIICPPVTNGHGSGGEDNQVGRAVAGSESGCLDHHVATPVKTFLSSNITPRSSSRKARAEAVSPISNGRSKRTPTFSRPTASQDSADYREDARATSGLGLRISNSGRQTAKSGSIVSDGPGSSLASDVDPLQWTDSTSRVSSPEDAPKFFHANDIKHPTSRPAFERPMPHDGSTTQVQSNKRAITNGRISSPRTSPTPEEQTAKFFYTNNHNESKVSLLRLSNGNNPERPQLHTIYSANTPSSPPRASSPLKEEILPRKPSLGKPSPRRHTRLVSNGGGGIKSPEAFSVGKGDLSRRSSLNSPRQALQTGHMRSPSAPATGPNSHRRSSIPPSDENSLGRARTTSITGPQGTLPHSVNPPSTNQELPRSQLPSQPPSPTKQTTTGQSKIDQMNELAANARRERKVLDLEISNSSLLAINRTLEREMRKQNAELRRFRRLSRSGRMSIAPSSRSVSGKISMLSEMDIDLHSDDLVSSSDDEGDPVDFLSEMSSTSASSRPSSPNTRAARTRFQDPKQIEPDLAAHRALLLDSQKMNISIKRCLAQSETLISSGRRALEYRAKTPEQSNQGARVLTPDENEDQSIRQSQGLLSPSLDQMVSNPWERSLGSMGSFDGGLETPDYSRWGPPTSDPTSFPDVPEPSYLLRDNDDCAETAGVDDCRNNETSEHFGDLKSGDWGESDIASIDGLEDDIDTLPTERAVDDRQTTVDDREARSSATEPRGPISPTTSPERKARIISPDPLPNQPGYRGSMQGLGHYLQAFSIFGASQQA